MRFCFPSALARRVALSGAASHRIIPLRLWAGMPVASIGSVRNDRSQTSLPLRSFAAHPSAAATIGRWGWTSVAAGHAPRPFYPRCSATRDLTNRSRLRRDESSPATLMGFFPSQSCSWHEVSQRFRCSFPTCRWAGFHLDLFLSRDRPSDIFTAAGSGDAWGPRFTHIRTKNGRSRKSTSASGFTPRAQSVSRHHQQSGGAILPWA